MDNKDLVAAQIEFEKSSCSSGRLHSDHCLLMSFTFFETETKCVLNGCSDAAHTWPLEDGIVTAKTTESCFSFSGTERN